MRWDDERYVRVYTRDTPEWCLLSWQARALFLFLLRAADRAGIVPVGRSGTKAVAALLRVPLEMVDEALPELLNDGCVLWTPDNAKLLIPNYIVAQESPQNDASRKRTERERARARAMGCHEVDHGRDDPSRFVTDGHESARHVTPSRAASQAVTPIRSDPIRSDPGDTHSRASAREPARETPPEPSPTMRSQRAPNPPPSPPRPVEGPPQAVALPGGVQAIVAEEAAAVAREWGSSDSDLPSCFKPDRVPAPPPVGPTPLAGVEDPTAAAILRALQDSGPICRAAARAPQGLAMALRDAAEQIAGRAHASATPVTKVVEAIGQASADLSADPYQSWVTAFKTIRVYTDASKHRQARAGPGGRAVANQGDSPDGKRDGANKWMQGKKKR